MAEIPVNRRAVALGLAPRPHRPASQVRGPRIGVRPPPPARGLGRGWTLARVGLAFFRWAYYSLALVGLVGLAFLLLRPPSSSAVPGSRPISPQAPALRPPPSSAVPGSRPISPQAPASAPTVLWEVKVSVGARVRAGPGTQYPRLCSLRRGVQVIEIGRQVVARGPDWIHVQLPEGSCRDARGKAIRTGWIREDLLQPLDRP